MDCGVTCIPTTVNICVLFFRVSYSVHVSDDYPGIAHTY